MEYIIGVPGNTRPVVKPLDLEGCWIELIDAEILGELSSYGLPLVGCHRPGKRRNEPKPWLIRTVRVGRVQCARKLMEKLDLVPETLLRPVKV